MSRDIEDLLAQRGVIVSYESIRLWRIKYGQIYARRLKRRHQGYCVERSGLMGAYANDVTLDFSRPGKPTNNAFIEAFNARVRQECLNQHWFLSLSDARIKIDQWRAMYIHERPHSRLGYRTPEEFAETHRKQEEKQAYLSQNFAETLA